MKNDQQSVPNPNSVNLISNQTEFKGDIKSESEIKFNGKLEGTINTNSKLILGTEGIIKGEVRCKNAIISGKIEGKIFVEELITLTSTCQIYGDLVTSKLTVEPGAILNGNCSMSKNTSSATTTNAQNKQ